MNSPASLARTIRRTRTKLGMSQQAFACRLGIKQQKLSEWERGRRLTAILQAIKLVRTLGGQ